MRIKAGDSTLFERRVLVTGRSNYGTKLAWPLT
jgi:hypothetical protein